jgi:hypothetical protein
MDDAKSAASVARMKREAEDRLADASILRGCIGRRSDANYLLELLAFEILLKAVCRINKVELKRNHSYAALFAALPSATRESVVRRAKERMGASVDYSDLPSLLATFARNFIVLRYPYEAYEGLTDEEYRALGENWIAKGAPLTSATFVYHSEALYGLTVAFTGEIDDWLSATVAA